LRELAAKYLTKGYLLNPVTETRFDLIYLTLSITLIIAPVILRILIKFKFKNRPKKVYQFFDKLWFWTSLSLGFIGLFIWFSRTQSLPIFGTRLASYIFLIAIPISAGLIFWYFKAKIPQKLVTHYEKSRKKKYLKSR
jgi:hypothetical protein